LGGCPAYSEEEVVDEERAHVIGRLAPFAPTPVQHGELDAVAEEKVPRMKIPVGLRKTVRAPAETPAPRHESTLECLALARCQEGAGMWIAVEDAHDALAVAHKLSDPPPVRRGLVALVGVRLAQEARQGRGPLQVDAHDRACQQSVQIQPVEAAVGFFDDLEELGRIGSGDKLATLAHEAHVQAPHMAWKTIVG